MKLLPYTGHPSLWSRIMDYMASVILNRHNAQQVVLISYTALLRIKLRSENRDVKMSGIHWAYDLNAEIQRN
jgi:hypothetical protein